jgi:positive regulator of sigma E activity
MIEIVEVVGINDKNCVEVTCPTTACKSCSGNMFCNVKGKTFKAKVDDNFEEINIGDSLKIYLPPGRTISTSFITLMVPLLMFPIFFLLLPSSSEGYKFLAGIVGIIIGFIAVGTYFYFSKSKYYPKVIEIIK